MNEKEICVSIFMPAYNQQEYIGQAIEHVLRQRVSFPIELVIGEDCSIDGTREVIYQYQKKCPDIIRVLTANSNIGAAANKQRILDACRGKYIAFCDGDDYWHDPEKLQKQVSFLESHPDYGLVHTDFDKLKADKDKLIPNWQQSHRIRIPEGQVYEELLKETFISTCTVCARRELVDRWRKDAQLSSEQFIQRDYANWLHIALYSKIGYLPVSTATKRTLNESMSRTQDPQKKYKYYLSLFEIQKTFMGRFPCSEKTRKMIILNFHRKKLRLSYLSQDLQSAKESYLFLCRNSRLSFKNTFYFFATFIKKISAVTFRHKI